MNKLVKAVVSIGLFAGLALILGGYHRPVEIHSAGVRGGW